MTDNSTDIAPTIQALDGLPDRVLADMVRRAVAMATAERDLEGHDPTASPAPSGPLRVLSKAETGERTGYSPMHLTRLEKAGRFPARVRIGAQRVGWLEHEVDQWIRDRAHDRGPLPVPKCGSTET